MSAVVSGQAITKPDIEAGMVKHQVEQGLSKTFSRKILPSTSSNAKGKGKAPKKSINSLSEKSKKQPVSAKKSKSASALDKLLGQLDIYEPGYPQLRTCKNNCVFSGLQIYGGPGSLSLDFKIWPITFQGNGPSGPILFSCEKNLVLIKNIHLTASLGTPQNRKFLLVVNAVKHVLSSYSKILITNGSLMKVESNAECSF